MKTAEEILENTKGKGKGKLFLPIQGTTFYAKIIGAMKEYRNQSRWIKMSDREPMIKDLPFLTYYRTQVGPFELWEDSDWFQELGEEERLQYTHWMPITKPEE